MVRTFRDAYEGYLSGLMEWQDLDRVLAVVTARPEGWWLYDTRQHPPEEPLPSSDLADALAEVVAFLRRHHRADYCGFAYVDDRAEPTLIKIYDPRNASSCSLGTPLPVYTLSRMRPVTLPFEVSAPRGPKGLFDRLLKGAS